MSTGTTGSDSSISHFGFTQYRQGRLETRNYSMVWKILIEISGGRFPIQFSCHYR